MVAGVAVPKVQSCSRHPPSHELWRGERLPLQFRREGGDDFFEAGIATQRVVQGQQFKATVSHPIRQSRCFGKVLQGELFFAYPCGDNGRIVDHDGSVNRILFERRQLDSTSAFAQRVLLSAKTGIDQGKNTKRRSIIRLRLHDLLLFGADRRKRGACRAEFGIPPPGKGLDIPHSEER